MAKLFHQIFEHHKILLPIFVIISLVTIATSVYFYKQYTTVLQTARSAGPDQTQALITKVGKHTQLPTDEEPTIATVSDIRQLKNQPFFADAKNGFKVLIYQKAQEAVLYDPFADKVIAVGPVNISQTATPTPQPIKIGLYNGTQMQQIADLIEQELQNKLPNAAVIVKTKASKLYTNTLVIDITGNKQALASQIATMLGGQVASSAAGETLPQGVDIVIIIGKK